MRPLLSLASMMAPRHRTLCLCQSNLSNRRLQALQIATSWHVSERLQAQRLTATRPHSSTTSRSNITWAVKFQRAPTDLTSMRHSSLWLRLLKQLFSCLATLGTHSNLAMTSNLWKSCWRPGWAISRLAVCSRWWNTSSPANPSFRSSRTTISQLPGKGPHTSMLRYGLSGPRCVL